MNLKDFFKGLGYDISGLTNGFKKSDYYLQWYRGLVEDFHNYYVFNGEKKVNKIRYSLQMSKKICENFADLLMNEKVNITLGSDELTKQLDAILRDNDFYVKANQGIEKTFALGMGAFVISQEEITPNSQGKIKIQFVNAPNIYPLKFDENGITECAFTSYDFEIDPINNKSINTLTVQVHTLNEQNNYVINNYKFEIGDSEELNPINLESENEYITTIETGSPNRWFIPIKPNVINNIDLYSPFGISIFANALDTIKALDLTFDSFINEIQNGRKRLFVTADAMKVSNADACYKNAFDPNDVLFYILDRKFDDESQYVQEVNVQLRVDELTKAIQMNLNLLSMKLGLGDNYYKFDGGVVSKTATEVISENSDLFRTLQKHKILLNNTERTTAHEMDRQIQLLLKLENLTIFSYNEKSAKEEICAIAKNKYGNSNRFISYYGETNESEWFAEVFMNLKAGNKRGLCRAMEDYLIQNRMK